MRLRLWRAQAQEVYSGFILLALFNSAKTTIKTGALEYSQKLLKELVEKGKHSIAKITKDMKLQNTLSSLADFMVERTK